MPPNTGIVHQVNLEHLARVTFTRDGVAFPDTPNVAANVVSPESYGVPSLAGTRPIAYQWQPNHGQFPGPMMETSTTAEP